jgi:hypothetical protein
LTGSFKEARSSSEPLVPPEDLLNGIVLTIGKKRNPPDRDSTRPSKPCYASRDVSKPLSYAQQLVAVQRALQHAGMNTSKATHFGFVIGTCSAEAAGASISGIAHAGGWATEILD